MIWFYIAYFAIFTLFLYPNRDSLHPHAWADQIQATLPVGFRGLIAMVRNWTFTSFYVMAEMWSTMIMTILFWGFANDVTSVKDAKRFYGLFGVGTNFSGVIAGLVATSLSGHVFNPSLPFGQNGWDQSVVFLNLLVIASSLLCMGLYWWINRQGFGYKNHQQTDSATPAEPTIKMGMRKNFAYLAKSRYLLLIAVLVITYNIAINLIEVVWKDQVKQLYPTPADFNAYMGGIVFWIGVIATGISMFVSGNVIRAFSWTTSALIAPVLTLITGVFFFACLLLPKESLLGMTAAFGMTPLALGVFFGSVQNCIVRGTKYSLIDTTKELAFVPLSTESKMKGKAAIDGVGSRLGKSGGSLIQQTLLVAFGSIAASTPIVGFILIFSLGAWILAARSVGRQFQHLTEEHQTLVVPDAPEEEAHLEPTS
jgi:AAA family ATP:ADP antiporter